MDGQLFYMQNTWIVLVVTSLALIVAALVGYGIGRIVYQRVGDKSQIGAVQASILGLLALLLGFTFAAASNRYDARLKLAVQEANALGTTFMRAQTLPDPYRTAISNMLHDYVDLRLELRSELDSPSEWTGIRQETEKLQQAMWKQATMVAKDVPNPITGLFVSSLNESIDLHATRVAVFEARVPGTILWILALISIVALGIVGYGFGLSGQRSWMVMVITAVLIAAVIVMIVDLDRPETGPARISQQSMVDLRNSLSGYEVEE